MGDVADARVNETAGGMGKQTLTTPIELKESRQSGAAGLVEGQLSQG